MTFRSSKAWWPGLTRQEREKRGGRRKRDGRGQVKREGREMCERSKQVMLAKGREMRGGRKGNPDVKKEEEEAQRWKRKPRGSEGKLKGKVGRGEGDS